MWNHNVAPSYYLNKHEFSFHHDASTQFPTLLGNCFWKEVQSLKMLPYIFICSQLISYRDTTFPRRDHDFCMLLCFHIKFIFPGLMFFFLNYQDFLFLFRWKNLTHPLCSPMLAQDQYESSQLEGATTQALPFLVQWFLKKY